MDNRCYSYSVLPPVASAQVPMTRNVFIYNTEINTVTADQWLPLRSQFNHSNRIAGTVHRMTAPTNKNLL